MSTARGFSIGDVTIPYQGLAIASTAVLIGSSLKVLYDITNIAGDTDTLLLLVAGAFIGATLLARVVPEWVASGIGALLLAGGMFGYYTTIPGGMDVFSQTGHIVADNIALLTGLSILEMRKVGTWALGVAPATVFVPWYLVFRRRYMLAAAAGGAALGFFVLTGDAGSFVTLVGMLGALGIVAFGTMARYGGTVGQVDVLVVALIVMVLLSATMSVVPGGRASPILPSQSSGGSGGSGGLISNSAQLSIQGSIELSPKVQYTVTANHGSYWKVASYDRYTGDDWIRTGKSQSYHAQSSLGQSYTVRQTFTVKAKQVDAMPAAWKPIKVIGSQQRSNTRISSAGSLSPTRPLTNGSSYSVVSEVPSASPSGLNEAGTAYPSDIEHQYTRLPGSTPQRLTTKTDEITADAKTPYQKATAIEQWLEENKEYSLHVKRPDGNIADSFVFDMDKGYCVYYATAMTAMLRTQGIPARFATGYTQGQRTDEDTWVVRGLDSHAWVEVYFPDTGWVRFDPTPSTQRSDAEQQIVDEARRNGKSGVDTAGSQNGTWTPETTTATTTSDTTTTTTTTTSPENGSNVSTGPNGRGNVGDKLGTSGPTTTTTTTTNASALGSGGGGIPIELPSKSQALYGGLLLVGLLLTARRMGLIEWAYRTVWMRWQPREDPGTDVERAFERLEYYLSRKHRKRRPGETPREYLASLSHVGIDERARRVGSLYERAQYAGEVTRENADEAVSLVNEIVRGSTPDGTSG